MGFRNFTIVKFDQHHTDSVGLTNSITDAKDNVVKRGLNRRDACILLFRSYRLSLFYSLFPISTSPPSSSNTLSFAFPYFLFLSSSLFLTSLSLETLQLAGHSLHQVADGGDALILIQLIPPPFFGLTFVAFQWDVFSCFPFISICSQSLLTSVRLISLFITLQNLDDRHSDCRFTTSLLPNNKIRNRKEEAGFDFSILIECGVLWLIRRATHFIWRFEGEFHYASQLVDEMLEPGYFV
ncbi:unnamed protein product [Lactuca virosa]|uniref:Uncharacterized protein n=1 Tax=Lactuca virosa TaxID=75947 RepID=A0AAU9N321_9ASTR|nr:unnamed protein product [Lactuca virosa]